MLAVLPKLSGEARFCDSHFALSEQSILLHMISMDMYSVLLLLGNILYE